MSNPNMTSAQSKVARAALGISQSKVARATGINRTQLALFEVQKYLLDDAKLKTLRSYYEDQGFEFNPIRKHPAALHEGSRQAVEDAAPDTPADSRVIDRFVVPGGIETEAMETLLAEIHANDRRIGELAEQRAQFDWLSGEPKPGPRDEILRLMARNYLRVRQLQLGELDQTAETAPEKGDKPTYGKLVGEAIGLSLAPLSHD